MATGSPQSRMGFDSQGRRGLQVGVGFEFVLLNSGGDVVILERSSARIAASEDLLGACTT